MWRKASVEKQAGLGGALRLRQAYRVAAYALAWEHGLTLNASMSFAQHPMTSSNGPLPVTQLPS